MLEYKLKQMKQTVTRMLLRARPPRTVWILRPHAEFLKLDFDVSKDLSPAVSGRPDILGEPKRRKKLPQIVEVDFEQLVVSLKGAKGVEHD